MKKATIAGIIVLVVLLVIGIVCFILKKNLDNNIMDGPDMVNENPELRKLINTKIEHGEYEKISYSSSGDMNGNVDEMTLDIANRKLITRYAAIHSDPIEVVEYEIPQEEIDKIIAKIDEYNFVAWSTLEKNEELIALDAATTYMTITCNNKSGKEWYQIYYDSKFPDDGWSIFSNFSRDFFDLVNKGEKINSYKE